MYLSMKKIIPGLIVVFLSLCMTVDAKPLKSDKVIKAYLTESTEYTDTLTPVQYVDDLSSIADMKYTDNTYAYQDGKVYYRRYHEDSYEETALWGYYGFLPGTEKEIVCIDSDGNETELFDDEGFGDIYLIDNRFYMTDAILREENGIVHTDTRLYSVDMQGCGRIDYGNGNILVIDKDRKIMIVNDRNRYFVIDYETAERKPISFDYANDYIQIKTYQEGWIYYEKSEKDYSVRRLCAVSLEGEQREIIALTSDINTRPYGYKETILNTEVDEERIYFIFGGYDGSAQVFQGGQLISVRLDGTDYKAVDTNMDDFYLSHHNGKPLIYYSPNYHYRKAVSNEQYETAVWDIEADICAHSDFPGNLLSVYSAQAGPIWHYYPADQGVLCGTTSYDAVLEERKENIYAIPDDSGKIVRVVMNLDDRITKWENDEVNMIQYKDLYYADGFLYFTVIYSAYDKDASIGWRDGYRRLRTEVYRLKTGEDDAQMLYCYYSRPGRS